MQGAWIVKCLKHMKNNKFTCIEPTQDAEDLWVACTYEKFADFLWSKQIGDQEVDIPRYFSRSVPVYHQKCQESAQNGYEGFVLS